MREKSVIMCLFFSKSCIFEHLTNKIFPLHRPQVHVLIPPYIGVHYRQNKIAHLYNCAVVLETTSQIKYSIMTSTLPLSNAYRMTQTDNTQK